MDLGFEGGFEVREACASGILKPQHQRPGWVRVPRTGFKTVLACDIMRAAEAAWISYFGSRDSFIRKSVVDLVKDVREGLFKFPQADVVTGGFPCNDFSLSGLRGGFDSSFSHNGGKLSGEPTEESRGMLYMWMKEVVSLVLPRVFVAENVGGIASLAGVKKTIESDFSSAGSGYEVVTMRLRADDYGVPQTRDRVFFIGLRKDCLSSGVDLSLIKPKPTSFSNPVPCSAVLCDLPEPEDSQDLSQCSYSKAAYIPEKITVEEVNKGFGGSDLFDAETKDVKVFKCQSQGQSEVDLNKPGPTIRSEHHGNIEFRRLSEEHGGRYAAELSVGLPERRLTVRECARIQTFPDDFEFVRTKDPKLSGSDGYKLIGNAVPPLLAFRIAWNLCEVWDRVFDQS